MAVSPWGTMRTFIANIPLGVGNNVQAIQTGSMVFGANSYAGGSGSLALGEYTFANVTMGDEFGETIDGKKGFDIKQFDEEHKKLKGVNGREVYTPSFEDEKMSVETLYTLKAYDTQSIQEITKKYYKAKTNKQQGTGEEKAEQSKDKNGTYNQGGIAIGSYSVALGDNALTLGRHAYAKEDSTVAIGNFAFAKDENAFALGKAARSMGKNSLAIGVEAEIWSPSAVAIGYQSRVYQNADGGVAIGQSAVVEANAGDSIALGKGSKAEAKKQAFKTQEINVGTKGLMFNWGSAGTSESDQEDKKKAVVSVGNIGSERIITNVAAGSVMNGSTDAINGGQLYSVIETFGKLGTDILGAEVETDKSKYGFKASTFEKVKYHRGQDQTQQPTEPKTFKDVIDETIKAVNSGMKFGVEGNGSNNPITKQLGDTLTFKGDDKYIKASVDGSAIKYSVEVANNIDDSSTPSSPGGAGTTTDPNDKLVTASAVKSYVTTKFGALSSTLNLETDQPTDGSKNKGSINLKSDTLKITGDSNITTSLDANQKNVSIKLKENLTGIKSIGDSNGTKITFDDNKKEIKLGSVSVSVNSEHKIVIGEGSKSDSQHTLAIGNKAIIGSGAKGSISIASLTNGEQGNISNAEWAVSIGNKNSITGGNDIVALGSNINVSGSDGKSKSVVAIGNGTQVTNGKESIAIGVAGNTKIESAEWAVAIGNNTKVSGGNDILALGSNISITGSNNGSVVVLGNGAKASAAENSVVIGKGAESKAQSAVVIGEGATVEGDAGDSVALGKNSKAKTKKLAPSGLDGNVGTNSLKISWTAGVSSGDMDKKSVFSIGDANSERIITNVAAGTVDNSSTDAINGGQLKSVIDVFGKLAFDVLGAEKETEKEADKQTVKDGFKKSTFTAVQYKRDPQPQGQPQQQAKVPMTFREAINESIAAINKGLIFKGDMPSAVTNGTQNTPHYLGSTIQIVRLATPANTGTTTTQPATTTPAITAYSGENLITQYSNTNGNAKIEIGFKNAPTFSKVMLAKEQTYNGGSGTGGSTDWKKELITKGYLEQALDKFKFKVSTGEGDDKTFEIGRGDTLKFTSGQNIQLTLAKQDGATSGSSASAATPTAPAPVASPSPAPAVASSSSGDASTNGEGSNGVGSAVPSSSTSTNGGGSGGASMATTGTAPSTPTSTTSDTSTTSNTTAVLTINTTDELSNIKSISSPSKNGSAGGNGTDTEVTKLTLDADKGATFQVGSTGAKVKINKDGIALTPHKASGANGSPLEVPTITIKAGTAPAEPSEDSSLPAPEGPSIVFSTKKTDGQSTGTGTITGLKDLADNADGTSATNKNYVDEQVKNLNNNRPFDFYLGNEKVVKGADGSFKKLKDVTLQDISEEEKKQVVIKAEPSTAPIGISNVASGLGLEAQTEEEKKKTQEKSAELTKTVEEKVKVVSEKAKALSDKAQTFTDLALAVSSLEQAINALPEGNDKTQAEAKLKENQTKLDEAKKALEQARNDLKEAQKGLTETNKEYEKNYGGYEKVAELVNPKQDSKIDLTNAATIGDLQAVAKSGMKFKGNDGVEVRKQLSETLAITGEGDTFNSDSTATGNIKVEMSQDGKGLEVKLSDQLKNMTSFETREVDGRKSTLNSNGLIVVNKGADNKVKSATYSAEAMVLSNQENDNKAVVTAGGVHFATTQAPATGARAGTGVITGLKDLDARSTGDMATNKNYVDEKIGSAVNRLDNAISTTNRRLQAGIAGALATGGLPMTVMPGKSMLAASAGSYKGQSAVALGYSRMSDNGKIMLRLQGTSTSTGDVGGSVGVGYQW
ncbi:hypothetical protein FWK55_05360 [Histophilus somni]|nr:hypothetical protein FWK55_05360 [Histophilus somni]